VVDKLIRLPPETKLALQKLACLGTIAEAATLSIVGDISEVRVHEALWAAVRLELVDRVAGSYRFVHDRVQEAAYSLIPSDLRAEAHLRIGRLLLAHTAPERREENLFDIANHLNRGARLLREWSEREDVARLNLRAGRKAKASLAYTSASNLFATGLGILGEEGWQKSRETTFALCFELADCAILSSNLEDAERRIEQMLVNGRSRVERAEALRLRVILQQMMGKTADAIQTAFECLRMFGLNFFEQPTLLDLEKEYQALLLSLGPRPIESLIDLPVMHDAEMQVATNVMENLGLAAYVQDPILSHMIACRTARLGLEYGTNEFVALGFAGIAVLAGPLLDRYEDGERFGRLALESTERHGFHAHQVGANVMLQMSAIWTQPIEKAVCYLERAIQIAEITGEVLYRCIAYEHRMVDLLARGDPLDQVWKESIAALDFVQRAKFRQCIDIISINRSFIAALRGDTGNSSADDADAEVEARVVEWGIPFVVCLRRISQLKAHFLLGNPEKALEFANEAKTHLWSVRPHIQWVDHCLYHSLALAAVFHSAPPHEQAEYRVALADHLRSLRRLADLCPDSFLHKYCLVAAEIARLEGEDAEAMRFYEQAIGSAAEHGFVQEQALSYEIAFRFYLGRGFNKIAETYLREARDCYTRWGADGKLRQLDEPYPRPREDGPSASPTGTIGTPVEQLDLATVIKVSQAVSGEIIIENLIETLMRTAIEQAGAERGLLVLPRVIGLRIAAEAETVIDTVVVHLRDKEVVETSLPLSVLNYVLRTGEHVILDDSSAENPFSTDPYVRQHKTRSVLCLPLTNQAKLIGVIYLENNLAARAFAPSRVAVLRLLASQAAISLENSRLYRDLAEREARIRRLVDANIIGIFICDIDGRIIEANDAFLRIVGYDREDISSGRLCWGDMTPPELRNEDTPAFDHIAGSALMQPYERDYIRKDGTRVPVLIGGALFEDGGNEGVAFVLDLSETKRAEEALRNVQMEFTHANRVATIGQLTASIAHEVNQPIAATINNAKAALRFLTHEPPNLEEVRQALEEIAKSGNRAGDVIAGVRALVKKTPPRMEPLDINDAIREVIELTHQEAEKSGVAVQWSLAPDLPRVHGDRVQLQQVVLNLIVNAIQAMAGISEGLRELQVRTERAEPGGATVIVLDRGPGLPPDMRERLFDAFYTTKSDGLGLGLSICRSIVEAHGGCLQASENKPHGAVFYFTVPAPGAPA